MKANTELATVNNVVLYAFNYEHNFLLKAFADHGQSIAEHLQAKFNNLHQRFGNGERAFLYLYTELSGDNREHLIEFINKTFKA